MDMFFERDMYCTL